MCAAREPDSPCQSISTSLGILGFLCHQKPKSWCKSCKSISEFTPPLRESRSKGEPILIPNLSPTLGLRCINWDAQIKFEVARSVSSTRSHLWTWWDPIRCAKNTWTSSKCKKYLEYSKWCNIVSYYIRNADSSSRYKLDSKEDCWSEQRLLTMQKNTKI